MKKLLLLPILLLAGCTGKMEAGKCYFTNNGYYYKVNTVLEYGAIVTYYDGWGRTDVSYRRDEKFNNDKPVDCYCDFQPKLCGVE